MNADRCFEHTQGAEGAEGAEGADLDSTPMLGLGPPIGFGIWQETSHLVCFGIATSPLGSAEISLELRLLSQ